MIPLILIIVKKREITKVGYNFSAISVKIFEFQNFKKQ